MPSKDSRLALRLFVRCPAELSLGAKRWTVAIEDLGAGGCRLLAPVALRRGEGVYLRIALPGRDEHLTATVAWCSSAPPHRTGLEFGRAGRAARTRFLAALLRANPGLGRPVAPRPSRRLPPEVVIEVGGGRVPTYRPVRAQTFVDVAHAERAAGRVRAAAAWLRAALALAPDDVEITGELALLDDATPGPPG